MATAEVPPAPRQSASPPPRRKLLSRALFLLGLMFFSYVLGAAVMFFELPTSEFLSKAFIGARAWNEKRQVEEQSPDENAPPASLGSTDNPAKTFDGFTLYATASLHQWSSRAFLVNMHGVPVHHW